MPIKQLSRQPQIQYSCTGPTESESDGESHDDSNLTQEVTVSGVTNQNTHHYTW